MDVDIIQDIDIDIDVLSNKYQNMSTHDPFRSTPSYFIKAITENILVLFLIFILILIFFLISLISMAKWTECVNQKETISIVLSILAISLLIKYKYSTPNLISPEKASNEIRECTHLSLDPVNLFVHSANSSQSKFKLRYPTHFLKHSLAYSIFAQYERDDIQFIPIFLNENEKQIGHLICCYYIAKTKIVNVYDSLIHMYTETKKRDLKRRLEQDIFNHLYPVHSYITFKKPKSVQPDVYSCSIFSMSYVTFLLHGLDPEKNELSLAQAPADPTMGIRTRIIQMLQQNKLLPFSTQYDF